MNKFNTVIGVDPDTDKHGVATYVDGKLHSLLKLNTIELVEKFRFLNDAVFSIENVLLSNAIYPKHLKGIKSDKEKIDTSDKVKMNIALKVGRCQQAQLELIRWLDYYGMPYILQKPASNWKKGIEIELFKKVTGWNKRSNKDTRSAAYFGFLAIN